MGARVYGQKMGPSPPLRLAVPGLEQVGYWLLKARTPTGIASAFNDRRLALWCRLGIRRKLPTAIEFEAEIEELRDLLVADEPPPGVPYDDEATERELSRSLRCLDAAEAAAFDAGLLG
jgi:hypothetical protein